VTERPLTSTRHRARQAAGLPRRRWSPSSRSRSAASCWKPRSWPSAGRP